MRSKKEQTMTRTLVFGTLLALAACAASSDPPQPSGEFRALNAGRWIPTEAELRGPLPPVLPARTFPSELGS